MSQIDYSYCRGCVYYEKIAGLTPCCSYIFMQGRKRPCPPGKECTVKVTRKKRRKLDG